MNKVVGLLVASIAVNYLDRGVLSVSMPSIRGELGLSPEQAGMLLSAFFWSYSMFQIVAGWAVDRYDVKPLFAGGYTLWSIAVAAAGFVTRLDALIGTRVLLGLGESIAYPAVSRIIAGNLPEERRGLANALVDAGSKIGPALSTLLGGLLVSAFGWRAVFIGVGLVSLLWLIPWFAWMPPQPPVRDPKQKDTPSFAWLLRRRKVWNTALGMFCLGYGWYFLLTWMPSYLVNERKFSVKTMAVAGSVPFWVLAASAVSFGYLSDRLIRGGASATAVRKGLVSGGLTLCGIGLLFVVRVADANQAVAMLTASCFFLGMFTSNCWAMTQTLAGPAAAGKWTGIQNCVGNLGGVVSPWLTGRIVERTGEFANAFYTAGFMMIVGAVCFATLGELKEER